MMHKQNTDLLKIKLIPEGSAVELSKCIKRSDETYGSNKHKNGWINPA